MPFRSLSSASSVETRVAHSANFAVSIVPDVLPGKIPARMLTMTFERSEAELVVGLVSLSTVLQRLRKLFEVIFSLSPNFSTYTMQSILKRLTNRMH